MKRPDTKKLVLLAMLAAAAFMLVATIRIPVVLFLNYEPKDVVIAIGGFLLGPMAAFFISLLVALVEMVTISTTGPIGCLMNLLSSAAFACTAAYIYKENRSFKGAITGLAAGSATMIVLMILWNWLITPLYMGAPRSTVVSLLLPAFLPFNTLKAVLNSTLTLLVYKPLVTALRKTGLLPKAESKPASIKWGLYLLGAVIWVTIILYLLVSKGII